jgi:hypothetical protein
MPEKSSKHIDDAFIEKAKPKRTHEPQIAEKDGFKKQEELAKQRVLEEKKRIRIGV